MNSSTSSLSTRKVYLSFQDYLSMLENYRNIHGDCNVASKGENKKLGDWCSRMRQAYKHRNTGKKGLYKISDDDIQKLENIGFQWEMQASNASFDEMYQKLVTFKQDNGHCNVPQKRIMDKDAKKLAKWCCNVKSAYKANYTQSKKNGMMRLTDDMVQKLTGIGFPWPFIDASAINATDSSSGLMLSPTTTDTQKPAAVTTVASPVLVDETDAAAILMELKAAAVTVTSPSAEAIVDETDALMDTAAYENIETDATANIEEELTPAAVTIAFPSVAALVDASTTAITETSLKKRKKNVYISLSSRWKDKLRKKRTVSLTE